MSGNAPIRLRPGYGLEGTFVNEYGLDSAKVTWVEDDEEHVASLQLPPNVVHAPPGKSLQSMMKAGEIQAGLPALPASAAPVRLSAGVDKASAAGAAADTYPELIANVERSSRLVSPLRDLSDPWPHCRERGADQASSMASALFDERIRRS